MPRLSSTDSHRTRSGAESPVPPDTDRAVVRLFGTDGVRGLANAGLTPDLALQVAAAAVRVLPVANGRPIAVVGRDPRASGEMLEAAVCAGLASAGADVWCVGVLPTPAVAYMTAVLGADLGVILSASHNPMPDNGIKIFAAGGTKLPDAVEDDIERLLGVEWERPTGADVGRIRHVADAAVRYLAHLAEAVPADLAGLRIVVDCANGAASEVAPAAYAAAGADVVAIGAEPDGLNINDGVGSTYLEPLRAAVLAEGADIGIAHDGDADRCLAVDRTGAVIDGDQIIAILALAMADRGELRDNTVVATVMSNLGLRLALQDRGVVMRTTAVGDRYVLEELRAGGFSLGGEQSGHIVVPQFATTGDGVLTGLLLLARMAETGRSLAELASVVTKLPQVLVNVAVNDRSVVSAPDVVAAVADVEAKLGDTGRVLLRPSGTEPLVRVMVEAVTQDEADAAAEMVAAAVRAAS